MASKQDLVDLLAAEEVGGNFIAGPIGKRVFVGKINEAGVFEITPEGEEMLAALTVVEEKPKATKNTKSAKETAAE